MQMGIPFSIPNCQLLLNLLHLPLVHRKERVQKFMHPSIASCSSSEHTTFSTNSCNECGRYTGCNSYSSCSFINCKRNSQRPPMQLSIAYDDLTSKAAVPLNEIYHHFLFILSIVNLENGYLLRIDDNSLFKFCMKSSNPCL